MRAMAEQKGNPYHARTRLKEASRYLLTVDASLTHRLHEAYMIICNLYTTDFPTKVMKMQFAGIIDDLTWCPSTHPSVDRIYASIYANDHLYLFDNQDLRDRIILLSIDLDNFLNKGKGTVNG